MLDVDLDEFRELMATGNIVEDEMLKTFNKLSQYIGRALARHIF